MKKSSFYLSPLLAFFLLISCSKGLSHKMYASSSGNLYIKFIDDHTLEWKGTYRFPPEEYDYVMEGSKIRATRKSLRQVKYIDIIDDKTLQIDNGTQYYLK